MALVERYAVQLHGSPAGYEGSRALIHLTGAGGAFLGRIFFHDPVMAFPTDTQAANGLFMHLPSSMLGVVVDLLRNEDPVIYEFVGGRAHLGTTEELLGEGDG